MLTIGYYYHHSTEKSKFLTAVFCCRVSIVGWVFIIQQLILCNKKQLFSTDNTHLQYQLLPCYKQVGTDCDAFSTAYSLDILCGNKPKKVVCDQSKLREHLVNCLEKLTCTMFPKYQCNVKYNDTTTTRSVLSKNQHK